MMLPTLYSKDSHGELRMWRVEVKTDGAGYIAVSRYGLIGGTIQESRKRCIVGTAPASCIEQAQSFCKSLWNKQKGKGYVEDRQGEPQGIAPLPMLAHLFDKHKHKLVYPVLVQPKLDGFRCICIKQRGAVSCWSRTGKRFETTSFIENELSVYMKEGDCFDGELYKHKQDFNELSGSIRNIAENNSMAEYHIYDYIRDDMPQYLRMSKVLDLFEYPLPNADKFICVKRVETITAESEEEVMKEAASFVKDGYEGAIVRTLNNSYRSKYRSPELLKVKQFEDEEFTIVGWTDGEGKEEGAVIWVCNVPDAAGEVVHVRPRGTYFERRILFENAENYIGKELTVRFFGRSAKGIPRFPVGIRIREEE